VYVLLPVCVFMCDQFYLVTDLQSQNGRKCLRVEQGDRLGLYFEYNMSALCYQFNKNPVDIMKLAKIFSNVSHPVSDDSQVVQFDSIVYPYKFFAAAYFYYGKILCLFSWTCLHRTVVTCEIKLF